MGLRSSTSNEYEGLALQVLNDEAVDNAVTTIQNRNEADWRRQRRAIIARQR